MTLNGFKIKPWMIGAAAVVGILVVLLSSLQYRAGLRDEAIQNHETQISRQYEANRIKLSQIKTTFYSSLDVANLKSDKMNEIIENAVTGRYTPDSSARPGSQDALFSAIHEAYPDINEAMAIYDKLVDFLMTERKEFAQEQKKLQDMFGAYDRFTEKQGFLGLRTVFVGWAGIPTDALKCEKDGVIIRGQAAYDHMSKAVISSETEDTFNTGEDEGERVPR